MRGQVNNTWCLIPRSGMRFGNEARTCVTKVTNQSMCTILSLSGLGHSTCVCVCVCVHACMCVCVHVVCECMCDCVMRVSRRFTVTMDTNSKLSLFKIMLCHTVYPSNHLLAE